MTRPKGDKRSRRKHDITTFAKPAVFHQIGTHCDYYRIQSIEFCTNRRSPPSSGWTVVFCVTGKNSRSTENGRVAPPLPYVTLRTHFCPLSPLCAGSRAAHNGESPQKTDVGDCWPSNNVGIGRRPATSVLSLALSAYRFGGRRALNSASQHSTDSGPWPAEVLSLGALVRLPAAAGSWSLFLSLMLSPSLIAHLLPRLIPTPPPKETTSALLAHSISK